jgi:hypothetical protein
VVGYPKCPKRDPEPATGPWAAFHRNAYDREQQIFPYVLLTGNGASHAASADSHSVLLEWGSQGEAVEEVQRALKRERFYDGELDGDFGRRTLRSVLEFQTRRLGQDAADGIVGPITAEALGLTLPVLTQG